MPSRRIVTALKRRCVFSKTTDSTTPSRGEEFIMLLEDTTASQAEVLAQHLCMAVAEHDFARIGTLTVSAGVTQHKDDDDDQSLLVRVDNALYLSKLNGRNRVSVLD